MSKLDNHYLGNPNVRGDDFAHEWTKDELIEYKKCMDDPVYFVTTYCKVIHVDRGLVPFDLYDYQKEMFQHFQNNRFTIVLACRQSGKSISVVGYLLWYIIFKGEQVVGILANKGDTAREMLGRITLMLENIPFFLQPGCRALNKGSIEFSNHSKIVARATSASSIRGMSMNLVYLDEFAFVERDTEFYTSTYPVISSGTSTKVIITSTRNGVNNMFNKLYEGAVQKTNQFIPFRVDWWDVPGRDEEWKKMTIANTSLIQFNQEFGNEIIGAGDTLINPETLIGLISKDPIALAGNVRIFYDPIEGHNYIMTVDVSQGRGQDFSTFTIIDVSEEPFQQVCVFQDNMISPLLLPDVVYKYASHYNDAYVVVENNDAGQIVCNGLYYELEYENLYVESMVKSGGVGVRMTTKTKRIGCSNIKDIIEQGKLEISDVETIIEISSFVAKGKSYQAEHNGHDDLMMNLVMFGWFTSTGFFQEATDLNMKNLLYKEKARQIEDDMIPIGIFERHEDSGHPLGDGWEIWKG
jgi:hypothetical protein